MGQADQRRTLHDLFMLRECNADLAILSGRKRPSISRMIKEGGWREKRSKLWDQEVEKCISGKNFNLKKIVALAPQLLVRYLSGLLQKEDEMEMKDAKFLSDIIANVDRIVKLEDGLPTEHSLVEHRYSSMKEMQSDLQEMVDACKEADPLFDDEELH